jgi:hypothetical protein
MMERIGRLVPMSSCVAAPGMARAEVVALEYLGRYRVDAVTPAATTGCKFLLIARSDPAPGAGWQFIAREQRNRSDDDVTDIYRRTSPP